MQIVIDISEDDYEIMKHNIAVNNPLCPLSQEEVVAKIANGTPLPKGIVPHDVLIDRGELKKIIQENDPLSMTGFSVRLCDIYKATPIIEADKEKGE